MKIMITYPPLEGRGIPTLGQNRQFQWFSNPSFIYPLVPASAATLLKQAGHAVVWDDCIASGRSVASFWKNLRTAKPDLVAMETKTPVIRQHWDYARNIKAALPGARVVLMGDHVTALPRETLENSPADYAITGGDYDFQLQSIVAHHENGTPLDQGIWYRQDGIILESAAGCATRPLDDLPWIDRTLTRWQDYGEKLYRRKPFTYTMVGRDCPYGKCTFCSWTTLYPRFKVRSPENFIGEIEYLVKELGIREIFDDTGTFPSGGWLESFCGRMRQSGLARRVRLSCNFRYDYLTPARAKMMKASGFRLLKLGLESANQVTLDRLKKGTTVADIERGCRAARKAGLETHLTMMAGYPWETRRQARRTVAFARRLMERGYAAMLQATVIV
ncbi:MAG: radical SAM protein, partial [Desulfobacterales bacterium]|nr:radical SAM protein [Desulfobacterales bacterium]